jgi:hypothetical protein
MPVMEGGGPRPPYHESFLENVIAVSWQRTGGVFVSGDFCCYQRYTRLPDNKFGNFKWVPLGSMAFGDGGGTHASSYARVGKTPTFLLGGVGPFGGVLEISNDGYKWENLQAGGVMGENIRALVWDKEEKRFYCDVGNIRCYYSPDGRNWFYAATSFDDHCKNPLGAPDGVYGYDRQHDVVIYPGWNGAVAIVNASQPDAEEFELWVGLDEVNAVTYAGGIWHCGGGIGDSSATTTSLDGGDFWFYSTVGSMGMTGDYAITTMVGAPIQHFKIAASAPVTEEKFHRGTAVPIPPAATTTAAAPALFSAVPKLGGKHARKPGGPGLGVMASAVSAPRRFGPRIPGHKW